MLGNKLHCQAKKLLEDAGIEHTANSTGHYQIEQKLPGDKTQTSSWLRKPNTQRADVPRFGRSSGNQRSSFAELTMRLLRQSSVTKIGSWAIEKNSNGEYMVIYVSKLDATAPDEALKGTIEYVARIANAMSNDLLQRKRRRQRRNACRLACKLSRTVSRTGIPLQPTRDTVETKEVVGSKQRASWLDPIPLATLFLHF